MCREHPNERKLLSNLPLVQSLSSLNRFHCLHLHLRRTANLFFPTDNRFLTQHPSSIKHDHSSHSIHQAALISSVSYKSAKFGKKHASLAGLECPSKGTHEMILWLLKLLHNVLQPCSVLLLQTHHGLEPKFSFHHLLHAFFSPEPPNLPRPKYPPRVQCVHLSRRVRVDVFGRLRDRFYCFQK